MTWSIGWDNNWQRDIGYGVPAFCDSPRCRQKIDRGLSHVCGGEPYGGDHGCGLYFCFRHLAERLCKRCLDGKDAYSPKPDHPKWIKWKLKDMTWATWRKENPDQVKALKEAVRDQ